jgi:SAM-dependent methyltransferase
LENTVCNLCGSDRTRPFLTRADRFNGEVFQFVSCAQCGLIYINPRPTQTELARYYPANYEAYRSSEYPDLAVEKWDVRRALDIQLNFVEKFIPRQGHLLDVGCATGNFMRAARKRGWEVRGIELIEPAAHIAQERYGLNVEIGSLETVGWFDACFNVITLWDVLEHLPDPKNALNRCHNLLAPDGVLIFSIPNLKSFDRYLFQQVWIGWDAPRQFNMFSEITIKRLFELTGFQLLEQKCLLGGKGTFLLSLDKLVGSGRMGAIVNKIYPLVSALLWPYRQFSYFFKRGPIITFVACKVP